MLPPSSRYKNKQTRDQHESEQVLFTAVQSFAFYLIHASFLLRLFFDPEDEGEILI
jgi:hypothetical protein